MQRQTYLLRKGARYHFRRRFTLDGAKRSPITVPLATAEPVEARHLVRRLAVKWDDVAVKIDQSFERGTLTIDEQRTLMRQALEEELAHATRHLALPDERSADSPTHRKVLIAAYTIVANMPHDAEKLSREQVEQHLDDTWSKAERDLLIRTLTLYITPMVVSRSDAHNALERLDAPINEGTLTEARRTLIGGRIEAQRRAALVDHPMFADRNVPAAHLLDDELVEEARRVVQLKAHPSAVPAAAPRFHDAARDEHRAENTLFAKTSDVRFSEQIEDVLDAIVLKFGYKPDNGQRRRILETFAWITADKSMTGYEPADIQFYIKAMNDIPNDFRFGELGKSGPMATSYSEVVIVPPTDETQRSRRTINRDLSILDKASQVLSKSYWRPRYGTGQVMNFLSEWLKVEEDPGDPKRMPWTPEHLETMYSLPLWQGGGGAGKRLTSGKSPKICQDAAYWLPLMGTYMGVAREEGAGFECVDFNFECDVPYVLIQANMTRSKDGKTKAGLKRASRLRVMPLHPELLRLGLREYVEAVATEGHDMIFPELYSDEAVSGSRGTKAPAKGGRRFYAISWCYLMDATHAILPLPATSGGKKADFHSQRTYNNSVLASPEISQTIIDKHMGHASAGTGPRRYLRRSLALGEVQELRERLDIMVRLMPVVTAHVPRAPTVKLLPLAKRSRVGSAPGRNAKARFCA